MIDNIELIAQSALRIETENEVIYFDPFKLDNRYKKDADYIFITHSHYDHFSPEDIKKILNENTNIIITSDLKEKVEALGISNVLVVEPDNEYEINGIKFETVVAYNSDKPYHKKEFNWVGYIITLDGERIYVAGDTDNVDEINNVVCNIACVPVGGTYTMNYNEAANLINSIDPDYAIPIHYGTVVGSKDDAIKFKELVEGADVRILL